MKHKRFFYLAGIAALVVALLPLAPVAVQAQTTLPTASQVAAQMVVGWNLGNTLEAQCGETAWGNPMVTQSFINSVKAAGFNSIRIPAAWDCHATNMTIDPAWLARVKQVVDYAISQNMYVIINIHWDGGWLENHVTFADQSAVNQKQQAYWTQIANYFIAYNEHLLFAGTNEVHHDYGEPIPEYITVQQSYNQTFVNAVRATGGNNASRTLVVQTYNTNAWHGLHYFSLPTDSASNRLIVEIHHYDPYDYTLNPTGSCLYWGAPYPPQGACSWAQEAYVDDLFAQVKAKWVNVGIPVIIGEYGVHKRSGLDLASRQYYLKYMNQAATTNGMKTFYWDNGVAESALFDRNSGAIVDQGALNAIMQGVGGGSPTPTPCGSCPTATRTNTPLPTNTATNTPVPTITPTPCFNCALKVQHKQASASVTDGEIKPHLRIHNTGSTSVALSTLKVRYWYTRDTAQPQTSNCDYAFVGCGNVTLTFVQITPVTGADFYLEVGFTTGAGSVAAGGNSGEIQTRFNKNDWSSYNELDDWSYAANAAFADNSKVTLYQGGALVWGSEPGGGGPTNTPTNTSVATNTPTNTLVATNTPTNTPVNTPTPTNTTCVCPTNTPTNTPVATNTPTNTPVASNTPTNTPVATNTPTNTPVVTNTPTNTPVPGGNLCATPTVITGGGSYSVPASGVCFKYVNAAFVRGAMWSVMNGSDSTVSNVVKWYGGRNETVTACINDTQTLNGNGAQLNNFTVAKDSANAMYVTITTNKINTVSMSIQNWQNGSGCSVAPTPQP